MTTTDTQKIPDGWEVKTLKEICIKIGSGSTPSGGGDSYKKEGISLIRSQNVHDFNFSYSGLAFIDHEQAGKLSNVIVEENDTLLNITGDSVARVCSVPQNILPARVNQHVAIIRANSKKLISKYIKYYLLNPYFKGYMLGIANSGGTRNALTKNQIEQFTILLPSLNEQQSIAAILSSLDDKIELLREQNKTLEAIAQTLFKSWFVDFEYPISAEQAATMGKPELEGKPYKSAGGKMVESELGMIPEGWRVGKLGDIATIKSGYAFKGDDFVVNGEINVIKIKDLQGKGIININNLGFIKNDIKILLNNQFKLNSGDILFAMSGNTTGKIGMMPITNKKIYLNQRVGKFFLKAKSYHSYLYINLMQGDFETKISGMGYGSAQPNVSPSQIENIDLIYPSNILLIQFNNLVDNLILKILKNLSSIQNLTEFRDYILPKLMKGEIRVKE